MRTVLRILGEEFPLEGAADELRRVADLAAALEARLGGGESGYRRLVLTALARARCEIDRLNDIIAEIAPPPDVCGRAGVLRA